MKSKEKIFQKITNVMVWTLFIFILVFGVSYSAGWHIADEILSGTFKGNYNFTKNVTFTGNVTYTNSSFITNYARSDLSYVLVENDMTWKKIGKIKGQGGYIFLYSSHNAYPNLYRVTFSNYPTHIYPGTNPLPIVEEYGYSSPASELEFRRVYENGNYYLEFKAKTHYAKRLRLTESLNLDLTQGVFFN